MKNKSRIINNAGCREYDKQFVSERFFIGTIGINA